MKAQNSYSHNEQMIASKNDEKLPWCKPALSKFNTFDVDSQAGTGPDGGGIDLTHS